jgi:integrase
MPRKTLKEETIAKLKKPKQGEQIDYFDGKIRNLVLRVNYGGKKTFRVLYYVSKVAKSGKKEGRRVSVPTYHSLGEHPQLKLKDAREQARTFNPKAGKGGSGSVAEVAQDFLKRYVRQKKLRTEGAIERLINKHILPDWKDLPFAEIKRKDVTALIDGVEDSSGLRQADMVLAIIRKMSNWYATRNDDYVSPVVKGMTRSTPSEHERERSLSDDDIRAIWTTCSGTYGGILKTLLLTGQRRAKVVTMKWTDVVDGVWTIATEAREKSNAGKLKLPQLALDVINAQPRVLDNPFVFVAAGGRGRFNTFGRGKAELDENLPDIEPWVVHDLRRTARALMSRAGVRPDVGELALGHSIQGIQRVYDSRGAYQTQVDLAIQSVADQIERILNPLPPNVVAIR